MPVSGGAVRRDGVERRRGRGRAEAGSGSSGGGVRRSGGVGLLLADGDLEPTRADKTGLEAAAGAEV